MSRELSRIETALPEVHALGPAQLRAVAALSGGTSLTAAAKAAGVSRPTIYAWIDNSPAFVAELNRARTEQREEVRAALRNLATAAVCTIRELIESPETPALVRLRAAQAVLNSFMTDPIGPTDAADVEQEIKSRKYDRMIQFVKY